ncbi:MAG: DNA repair protein RecO [Spirochaetales bacterium]|nr:DNA repair protein RecO [Spirochaetales bacterium]
MSRTREIEAIILSARRSGDSNKLICCLAGNELCYAHVYGAYKGKGKNGANCELLSRVHLYLYHNPTGNHDSVKDSVLLESYDAIRGRLGKIYCASVMCELVEKTHAAGGEFADLYGLLTEMLDLLETKEIPADYLLIQFFLHFLRISGDTFGTEGCHACGSAENSQLYYSFASSEILCPNCSGVEAVELSAGIRKYLQFTASGPVEAVMGVRLADSDRDLLKTILSGHIQAVNNIELKSLAGVAGV